MIIEGIGDEVITVLITFVITLLVSIIWKSTNVRERPPVRAVVIRSANSETIAEIPLQPQRQPITELQEAAEATAESIQNSTESPERPTENPVPDEVDSGNLESTSPELQAEDPVTIKIRFINEESLEIQERLSEKLGQFISKHLDGHLNLTEEDRVRLIYNGRVLGTNQSTLAELGLTDNCVVHCLVQRSVQNSANGDQSGANHQAELNDDFDLSSFCFPLLGALLTLIWICQVVYANYFNMTSTICLVTLSVLFMASAINWLSVDEVI